jgi:uncharacterized lipoprotein YddW (UPF0748 family)
MRLVTGILWLTLTTAVIVSPAVAAAQDRVILDSFDYVSLELARKVWQPVGQSPPVQLMRRSQRGGAVMVVRGDLATVGDRLYYDRKASLNLAGCGDISLWLHTDRPDALRGATLYLQSGKGWYGGWFKIPATAGQTWQKITLRRQDFAPEDQPAGWQHITGMRLSFWSTPNATGPITIAVDNIEAATAPIRLVYGDTAAAGQTRTIKQYHDRMARLLDEAGIPFVTAPGSDLARGGLAGATVAIFPHNPVVDTAQARAIVQFVRDGGKVIGFYNLPPSVASAIGVQIGPWRRAAREGELASVKLADGRTIRQDSWNMQTVATIVPDAKVVGHWVDRTGRVVEPAVVRSPRGQFMGHILLPGDDAAKRQFMLQSLAAVAPSLGKRLTQGVADKLSRDVLGERLGNMLETNRAQLPPQRFAEARAKFEEASKLLALVRAHAAGSEPANLARIVELSEQVRHKAQAAAMLAQPSWPDGFAGVWCHDPKGVDGWSWDQAAEQLADNGIDAIFVNVCWGGRAYYPSDHLPPADDLPAGADLLAECIAACRKHGVEVHAWKVNYNLSGAPAGFVNRMRREKRLQGDRGGREMPWLSPSHPDNFALERDSMLELVRKYDVDGIHFDYIRYPSAQADYSAGARQRFEQATGQRVAHWPADVISGALQGRFAQWRQDQVTRVVESVYRGAKQIRPSVKVSAAVFAGYPKCRENVGQDWVLWAKRGWLDFVCPMNYTNDAAEFGRWVAEQRANIGNRTPLIPGIGAASGNSSLDPIATAQQIALARKHGGQGFILFQYTPDTAIHHLPALRLGVTAE